MKVKALITLLLALAVLAGPAADAAWAMRHGGGHMGGQHMHRYGGYCRGPKWGMYGARRRVQTENEVRELLTEFLKETEFTVGDIRDGGTYFEADILSAEEEKVDLLIVDKRTCRIRSAY